MNSQDKKQVIGWREWVGLPELSIPRIKVKIDTGARTSSLDTRDYELIEKDGVRLAKFRIIYGSRKNPREKICTAKVVENRTVTNSGGQAEERIVIVTKLELAGVTKDIEITLTKREGMKFRMLLGRTSIGDSFLVDSENSYLTGSRRKGITMKSAQKLK